jgi:GntR family transcriptional regulator, trigonelline degradation regulator
VRNASPAQRTALVRSLRRIERLVAKGAPILAAKDDFYEVLFAGGGNEALRLIVAGLHARVSLLRSLSLSFPSRPTESLDELRAIVNAVLADDAEEAGRACSRHVEEAGRLGLQALVDFNEALAAHPGQPGKPAADLARPRALAG